MSAISKALTEQIADIVEDETEQNIYYIESVEYDKFKIDSLELAVWADKIIKEAEDKVENIIQIADYNIQKLKDKIEKLEQWKVEAAKKDNSTIEFFKNHLHAYHIRVLEQETSKGVKKLSKTIKLPNRDLTCKAQQPEFIKDDILTDWVAINHPDFIETKQTLKWGEFKKTLTIHDKTVIDENGEVVPITVVERPDKFDWKLK